VLARRLATAAVGIPLGVVIVYLGGVWFAAMVLALVLVGLHEFYAVCRRRGARPHEAVALAGAVLLVLGVGLWPASAPWPVLGAAISIVVLASMAAELRRGKPAPLANVGATLFGFCYVGWLFCYLLLLRRTPGTAWVAFGREVSLGFGLVLFVLAASWCCDSAAYFVGRSLGRRPLAPRVSPKKTVEGFFGGVAGAMVGAAAVAGALGWPAHHALALGLLTGVVGQAGDLANSLLKREAQVKDYGALFPGHGGVLDRFDSMLFNAPLVFYYVHYIIGVGVS